MQQHSAPSSSDPEPESESESESMASVSVCVDRSSVDGFSVDVVFLFFLGAPPRSRSLMYATTTGAATTSSSLYFRPLVDKYSTASASAATPRRSSTCLAVRPCGTNSSGRRHFFPCTKNLTLMPRSGSNTGSAAAPTGAAAARYTNVGTFELTQKAEPSTNATRRKMGSPYTKTEVKRLRNKSKRDGTNTVRLPPE